MDIKSRQNPQVKKIVELHSKKGRLAQKKFIAQGFRTCATLHAAGYTLIQLYVTQDQLEVAAGFAPENLITLVNNSVMEKISTVKTPSGILCVFEIPQPPKANALTAGLVLAQISDPGNMGTLIRTAAAMNIKTVVIIEGTDPWSPKVIQSTVGNIGLVNIFQWDWQQLTKNKNALKLYALVVSGGKNPREIDFKDTLLVVGSEAHGIPSAWLTDCSQRLTLPMPGNIESLNAAVAGSIALYLGYAKTT